LVRDASKKRFGGLTEERLMSRSHLSQFREALNRRGWQITEKLRGDDNVKGAATWWIRRHNAGPTLLIDFDGFGAMGEDISLEASYGCNVRGSPMELYFRRVNRSRELWVAELTRFVSSLDTIAPAAPRSAPEHGGS
jgi:hypothetical protein